MSRLRAAIVASSAAYRATTSASWRPNVTSSSVTSPLAGVGEGDVGRAVVDGQDGRGVVVGGALDVRAGGQPDVGLDGGLAVGAEPDRYRGGHAVTSWRSASGQGQPGLVAGPGIGPGRQQVRDRLVWQGGQAPVPPLDGNGVGQRLGGELAGEVDVPGLQVLGQRQGDQQRRTPGRDGQQRRPVLIPEEGHPGPGVDGQRQRRDAAGGHQAASLCSAAGRGIGRDGARTPVALSEYARRAAHLPLPWHRPVST